MRNCSNCNTPAQANWDACPKCGSWLLPLEATQSIKRPKNPLVLLSVIASALAVMATTAVILVLTFGQQHSLPGLVPGDLESSENQGQEKDNSSTGAAIKVVDQLLDAGVCSSVWSAEDYAASPSFRIESRYWRSGDIRVCEVVRTANATKRWVTVITGTELLTVFGSNWEVPYGSISIHTDSWTLVTDTIHNGDKVRDDEIVQSILVKLGGSYTLPRS